LTGGLKGLRIIVLQPMFNHHSATEETLAQLETIIRGDCEKCGAVEKITIFANNPRGVVIVKFAQPAAASEAIKLWDGRIFNGRKVEATFWDSVTDYNVRDEEKEKAETEKRHEQFGDWLESQDIPEELRLQVET
jgi:HIV Tat-specific factor 1